MFPENPECNDPANADRPADNKTHFIKDLLVPLAHLDLAGFILRTKQCDSKAGGYSDVYSAWSNKHDKKVAVKQVRNILKKDISFAKVAF